MTVQNSVRSYLGIAKEATHGTVVAPTDFIPVSVGKLSPADVIGALYDDGLRGSMVKSYNYIQGRTNSTFDFGGPAFADTIGYAIAGLLGEVTTTGASAPYTHVISLLNSATAAADAQPNTFTLTDFYAAAVRSYPGCKVHDFTLKFSSEGLLEYDAKATGWASSAVATPTPTFSTVLPTPVWAASVTVGGSTVSNTVDGSLTMSRPISAIFGIATTQNPYSIFQGALETSGSFTFVMEADTELTRYLTNTQPAIVLNWSQGTGATATQIQATMTKGAYTAAVIQRSKDFVEVMITVNAQGNTTDRGTTGYSSIKWTLQNAKPSGTYQ